MPRHHIGTTDSSANLDSMDDAVESHADRRWRPDAPSMSSMSPGCLV